MEELEQRFLANWILPYLFNSVWQVPLVFCAANGCGALWLSPNLRTATPRLLHAIDIFDANIFESRVMNLTLKTKTMGKMRRLLTDCVCHLPLSAGIADGYICSAFADPF
jgi:hypothetical protein